MERALHEACPATRGLSHLPLGTYPTPVQPVDLATVVPAFRGRAWVKREDLSAPELGGNKVRKLEFLLAGAADRRRDTVVTIGGVGSNHAVATAFYAPAAGLRSHIVLFPHHMSGSVPDTLRALSALADGISYSRWAEATPVVAAAAAVRLLALGRRPAIVPPGGSSPAGTLGALDLGLELARQIASGELDEPDEVFCAYGSGGTAAGLGAGLALARLRTRVVAVRVYDPPAASRSLPRMLAALALRRAGVGARIEPWRIRVETRYLGAGYAAPTEPASAAATAATGLGLRLDPTYTAKAFAAFLDAAGSTGRSARLVFVQTYDGRIPERVLAAADARRLPPAVRHLV